MDTPDRQAGRSASFHLNRVRRSRRTRIVAAVLAVVALPCQQADQLEAAVRPERVRSYLRGCRPEGRRAGLC
jgi:hypothetical protein